jgi:hypothetical protein
MKITNLSPIISDKNKIKEEHNNSSNGITKKLLEKYKPKGHYYIENIYNRKDQEKVA